MNSRASHVIKIQFSFAVDCNYKPDNQIYGDPQTVGIINIQISPAQK